MRVEKEKAASLEQGKTSTKGKNKPRAAPTPVINENSGYVKNFGPVADPNYHMKAEKMTRMRRSQRRKMRRIPPINQCLKM